MKATPQLLAVRINEQYPTKINWIKSEPIRARVAGTMASIKLLLEDYSRKVAAVQNDNRLTAEGKTEALKPVHEAMRAGLSRITVGNFKAEADKIVTELKAKKPADENPVLTYMQEMEIRTRYQNKSELELREKYEAIARGGQDSIMARAMENDPEPMGFISPERTAARREAVLMAEFPEQAQVVEACRAAEQLAGEMLSLAQAAFVE